MPIAGEGMTEELLIMAAEFQSCKKKVPRKANFLSVKKIAELVSARYNHLADLAAALVKLQIANSSKLFAVPQVYDILGLQVRKTHHIFVSFSSIDYYMPEGFGTVISFLQIARLMNIFRLF